MSYSKFLGEAKPFWPLERDAMFVLDDMSLTELERAKRGILISVYNDEKLFRAMICDETPTAPYSDLCLAIRFMLDRGYTFDYDFPSWINHSPEHWQPLLSEFDVTSFIDQYALSYIELERMLKLVEQTP